jgi:transcriptional regulator with XRE-family HTH domain
MSRIGERLIEVRSKKMWTQARLAREAGVSPTTVSGIETGRISRPHFGTLSKLARALDVDPRMLLAAEQRATEEAHESLSMDWVRTAREEDFEQGIEDAPLESLETLSGELEDERRRLQTLYGEFPRGSEQRKFIKRQIREVAAQSGSVTTSAMFHRSRKISEPENGRLITENETRIADGAEEGKRLT